jgi:2-polyprenyl-3-methyl-5-hydroxy-6-metoxy-1,4-benzoquinol methylase
MSKCQCQGIESTFDQRLAEAQLRREHARGPQKTTRLLVEALREHGVEGKTLLDIGGGIGAVQHMLLEAGIASLTGVDASSAYTETATEEARLRGFAHRARFHHGDFVERAGEIGHADIVTLDRVICCYDDMNALVTASARKARDSYGMVFPRSAWWTRLGVHLLNFSLWIRGNPFRIFAHRTEDVEFILRRHGLSRIYRRTSGMWQVAVYARSGGAA